MIQLVLLAILIGLALAHLLRPVTEGFLGGGGGECGGPTEADRESPPAGYRAPTMLEDKDDIRDIPWIASWSVLDREARKGQTCMPLRTEPGPDGTVIEIVQASCEAGMAHTRPGDRICIPEAVPEFMRDDTVRHELIHIYQRRFPDAWRKFYRRNWSFEFHPAPPPEMPADIIQGRRSNPDTWDPAMGGPWVSWMGRYWTVPVYQSAVRPQLREAATIWWDSWRKEALTEPPATWTAFFGNPAQTEHPHELAAVLLTAEDTQTEAGRRLASWWSTAGAVLRGQIASRTIE